MIIDCVAPEESISCRDFLAESKFPVNILTVVLRLCFIFIQFLSFLYNEAIVCEAISRCTVVICDNMLFSLAVVFTQANRLLSTYLISLQSTVPDSLSFERLNGLKLFAKHCGNWYLRYTACSVDIFAWLAEGGIICS